MTDMPPRADLATHEVGNQPPARGDADLFRGDRALRALAADFGADEAVLQAGHKWFCSAPMSDGFLTLAQAPGGLTYFLVPRWLEDGRNGIQLQRIKNKLGDRANASAEIEYHGALAHRERGRVAGAVSGLDTRVLLERLQSD